MTNTSNTNRLIELEAAKANGYDPDYVGVVTPFEDSIRSEFMVWCYHNGHVYSENMPVENGYKNFYQEKLLEFYAEKFGIRVDI